MNVMVYIRRRPDTDDWQAFWIDPFSGRRKTKALRATTKKEATKIAAVLEAELQSQTSPKPGRIGWDQFRKRFEAEYLPTRSKRTQESYRSALNQFENEIGHPHLELINESLISQYQSKLRQRGLSSTTVASVLRHLKAALRWASRMRMLARVPIVEMPRVVSGKLGKGRPLSQKEFKKLLASVPKVFASQETAGCISRMIEGLWLSGLRISEACALHWADPPVHLDLDGGKYPRINWSAAGHKARKDDITPITPDFAKFLKSDPDAKREGLVFPILINGVQVSRHKIGRMVSAVGNRSKIKVSETRFASAHDLRRSFATRWSRKVRPVTLKSLMRHSDIKTTLQYYVDIEADDIGEELWRSV